MAGDFGEGRRRQGQWRVRIVGRTGRRVVGGIRRSVERAFPLDSILTSLIKRYSRMVQTELGAHQFTVFLFARARTSGRSGLGSHGRGDERAEEEYQRVCYRKKHLACGAIFALVVWYRIGKWSSLRVNPGWRYQVSRTTRNTI